MTIIIILTFLPQLADLFHLQIDWNEFARRTNVKHGKNAKQGMKKIFDKLKASTGGEDGTGNGDEAGEESLSPKKAVKKASAKKTAAKEEKPGSLSDVPSEVAGDDEVEPKTPPKKASRAAAAKKNTVTPKAAVKKIVGRTVAPKKASEGGPKPKSTKTRAGSKVTKVDVEAEAEVEAEADADADTEDAELPDADVKEDAQEELKVEGKSTVSHIISQLETLQAPGPAASSSLVSFSPALTMRINGVIFNYTRKDIRIAQSHETPLPEYLIWKQDNDYSSYVDEDDDSEDELSLSAPNGTQSLN